MSSIKTAGYVAFSLGMRALLTPFRLLGVKQNRVLFVSFRGKQYSCNPRYISEELQKNKDIEIIWAFHHPEKFAYLAGTGVRVIGDRGPEFLRAALTSRVVVTNTYYKPYLPRRKKQFYLRTWHGGGAYKRVDYPKGLLGLYIRMQQQGADLYLSSGKTFTRQTIRGVFSYQGKVLEEGMPRNDMFITGAYREIGENTKKELGLANKKIALYAPTYRDSGEKEFALDTENLRRALQSRFGGDWEILTRGHHVLEGGTGKANDVTDYPDMQPLLAAADVLVTDYSSSMWDMSLMEKPVFLYCTDLASFKSARDFFTDIHSWPFPLAEDNAALAANIEAFDGDEYVRRVRKHHEDLGCCESGKASETAAHVIESICKGEDPYEQISGISEA